MKNKTFVAAVFFVLGFATVFSLLGVLLQGLLSSVSFEVQRWLARVGGAVIILFGITLLGLVRIPFLEQEHKLRVTKKFGSLYVTSFVFGAAFAVGWTPCVGPVLGAILTLAVAHPSSAFLLLLSYSLGLGIPFLLVGLFVNQAQGWISEHVKALNIFKYIFGAILIILGVLVFTSQLSRVASFPGLSNILVSLDVGLSNFSTLNLGIAFLAGVVSFLSPCVLPLIPAFLAYLASTTTHEQ
ncbi:MAG: cytochrome c biogenesis protein CcdA [Nanoarchaeota archaeon]|nr:cytochrome c biogenesis protein CcdA [Nanoarchaeota archaeon]